MPDGNTSSNNSLSSQLSFYVDGPAVIYYGEQDCSAAQYMNVGNLSGKLLGFTDGGVAISYQTMTHRINGDEYGGSEGMPAEQLILGGQASIRATIVKWETGAFEDLMCGANAMVPEDGTIPCLGKPYFSSQYGFSFWVIGLSQKDGYYFPKCELASQPRQWNVSSLERRMSLSVQAYSILSESQQAAVTFFTGTDDVNVDYQDCAATIA